MATSSVANIIKLPELRNRLLFTLFMLAVYRIGVFIPTPGVDVQALKSFMSKGTVFDIFNLFSGGALDHFSVLALGIMPYISSSIIMQLLTVVIPSLERLSKEGDQGRHKINQYTRYATVVLSLIQGFGISYGLEKQGAIYSDFGGMAFYLKTMIILATGTIFAMWIGEQITERGLGNGISLVIFSGIVTRVPASLRDAWATKEQYAGLFGFLLLLSFVFLVISFVIFFERSHRKIPVQYAKKAVGQRVYSGQTTHLPLKLNSAGVIPPIFASSIILFPATIAQFSKQPWLQELSATLSRGWLHTSVYIALIIFFSFFYTAVTFNPQDLSENIRKQGGYIPGIRPGQDTSNFIDRVLTRLTLGGAIYIATICVLPELLINQFGIPPSWASTFGGTSLLIIVGVAMDTLAQIEAHLISRNYQGVMGEKGGRFRGRSS